MTIDKILQQTTEILSRNNIEDAYLEARLLIGHGLKKTPVELYTEIEHILTQQEIENVQNLIEHRLQRKPTSYITNHKEFFGISFYVDHRVLIPRPETELLVEKALKFARSYQGNFIDSTNILTIADIGTGCGNIAISLALNIPNIKVYAVDISSAALEVAKLNCVHYNVTDRITLFHGNLLNPITEPIDLIIANLPYIASSELVKLSPEIYYFEPKIALDGGEEGLDQIHQLIRQASEKINHPCHLLLEIGAYQEQAVTTIVKKYLPSATFKYISDLNNINRVIEIII